MFHIIILVALPLAMAFIHRLRGGGFVTLPFKSTYVLWPIVGLLAWVAGASWPVALAWALGYLAWILPGWMATLTRAVGAPVPADQVMSSTWDVRLVTVLSFGHPVLGCFVRAGLFLVPLAVALACLDLFGHAGSLVDLIPLVIVVAAFFPAYWLGFRMLPTNMSAVAEPLVGASWGLAMIAARFVS